MTILATSAQHRNDVAALLRFIAALSKNLTHEQIDAAYAAALLEPARSPRAPRKSRPRPPSRG